MKLVESITSGLNVSDRPVSSDERRAMITQERKHCMPTSQFSIGIEEEFQAVDSQSGALRSSINTLLERRQEWFAERLHAEWAQSMIEVTSNVFPDIGVARREL